MRLRINHRCFSKYISNTVLRVVSLGTLLTCTLEKEVLCGEDEEAWSSFDTNPCKDPKHYSWSEENLC